MEEKLQLVDPEASSMSLMKRLAYDDAEIPADINTEQLLDRSKMFLVARARNSLTRIIKLTDFLEKLEDKFIASVNTILDNEPNSIQIMVLSMETISKLLQDANDTVMQVLKDDRLQQIIINTTNIITPEGTCATVIDADSRDAIRNLAGSLLTQLSSMGTITEEPQETTESGSDATDVQ